MGVKQEAALTKIMKIIGEQASLESHAGLVELMARQLCEATGALAAIIAEYVHERKVLVVRKVDAEEGLIALGVKVAGERLIRLEIPFGDEEYTLTVTNPVLKWRTLSEATGGAINPAVSRAVQSVTGIDRFLIIPNVINGQLYGTSTLALGKDQPDPEPDFLHAFASVSALSWRRKWAEERLRTTLLSVGDAVIATDTTGRVEFLNPVAEDLTGWQAAEAMGRLMEEVFVIRSEKTGELRVNPTSKVLLTGETALLEQHTELVRRDGSTRAIEDSAAPILDDSGVMHGVVLVFRDVSEKRREQERMNFLTFHDVLTGLYNRRFYEEEINRLDTERNLPISVIMGDVNGLKIINDSFGHAAGDQLLQKAASAIKSCCRSDDIIARWGGDEFVVLLPRTSHQEAEAIVRRIMTHHQAETVNMLPISMSLGCATKETPNQRILSVLQQAEDTMYVRKKVESVDWRRRVVGHIVDGLYARFPGEKLHAERSRKLAVCIGRALNLQDKDIDLLHAVSMLHDLGKVAMPEELLNTPERLTQEELDEVRRHSDIGFRILNSTSDTADLAPVVLAHHERWDGTGYPQGLRGEEIPLLARIITLVDAFDAMTGDRFYRQPISEVEAVADIKRNAGKQFDPQVAKIFVEQVLGHEWENTH